VRTTTVNFTALYSASGPVTISPALPASSRFRTGVNTHAITAADGGNSCSINVTVVPCVTNLTCESPAPIQLPTGSYNCSGVPVGQGDLVEATGPVTISPPLSTGLTPPGVFWMLSWDGMRLLAADGLV
jgi:hypothetical protein